MASQSAIKLTKLVERFELEVLNQGKNYDRCLIRADDINRPALQILGFFDYFAPDRIQVIGKVEWTYLNNQSSEERRKCFDAFLEKPIPALILTRSLEPFPELMEMAVKHHPAQQGGPLPVHPQLHRLAQGPPVPPDHPPRRAGGCLRRGGPPHGGVRRGQE